MYRTGLVILVLLALLDVVSSLPFGDNRPPVGVVIAGLTLGLISLAAAVPAWHGNRKAASVVIGSRALSALLGIGAFFDDRAPGWVLVGVSVAIVLTAVAVVMMMPSLRLRRAEPA
uniref:hypothetical protein n=1 Tax=Paractinoplanes polyasparticus TaxID=2856853 RepID=UPI001C85013F|nr:hypothetical protein [Actinoplanes polyasparticus]